MKTSAQIAIAFVCLAIGFGLTWQIKGNRSIQAKNQTREVLVADLIAEKDKSTSLYKQLLEANNDLELFKKAAAEGSDYSAVLVKRLEKAEILAGLNEVEGPGVIITVDDSKAAAAAQSQGLNPYLVHDEDLLKIVNELRAGGAEAISVNGERVLATTEVRCAGPVILVNGQRLAPPYEIKAIGDPDNLDASLRMRDGIVELLKYYGFDVSIVKSNKFKINMFTGPLEFKNAVPVVVQ